MIEGPRLKLVGDGSGSGTDIYVVLEDGAQHRLAGVRLARIEIGDGKPLPTVHIEVVDPQFDLERA